MFPWGDFPKILWVTFGSICIMFLNRKWIGPHTKIWEMAKVAEIAMDCRAWVNRLFALRKIRTTAARLG